MISIIVPNYNKEEYLRCFLENIISKQTKNFFLIELLFIDDFSTDDSTKIIEEYMENFSFIRLIKNKKNIGVALTRNIGIENSNYPYILFVDSDDVLPEQTLERYISAISSNSEVDIFYGNVKTFRGNLESITPVGSGNLYIKSKTEDYDFIRRQAIWNKVYKKSCISDIRFKPLFGEDFNFLYKVINNANRIMKIDITVLFYKLDVQNSITNSEITEEKFFEYITMFNDVYSFIDDESLISLIKTCEFASYCNPKLGKALVNIKNKGKFLEILNIKSRGLLFCKSVFWNNYLSYNDFIYEEFQKNYIKSIDEDSITNVVDTINMLDVIHGTSDARVFMDIDVVEISKFSFWQKTVEAIGLYESKVLNLNTKKEIVEYYSNNFEDMNFEKVFIGNGDYKLEEGIYVSDIQEYVIKKNKNIAIIDVNCALYKNSIVESKIRSNIPLKSIVIPPAIKSIAASLSRIYGTEYSMYINDARIRIKNFITDYFNYYTLFKNSNTKLIETIAGYWRKPIMKAAQDLGITVIEYQYAMFSDYHIAFSSYIPPKYFPEKIVIWSPIYNSSLLYPYVSTKKVVDANYITNYLKINKKYLPVVNISECFNILVISQWMLQKEFVNLCNRLSKELKVKVSIKLHPKEELIYRIDDSVNIISNEVPFIGVLGNFDIVIGSWSSALIDCIELEKEIICVKFSGYKFFTSLFKDNVLTLTDKEILEFLEKRLIHKI